MIKVWTGERLNYSYVPLLYPNWGTQTKDSHLFFSKKHNKKIIVFVYGDSNEKVKLPNVVVFRTSSFKKKKAVNEIMCRLITGLII